MSITTKQFQILTDVNLVWDFLTDIYEKGKENSVKAPFFEYALKSSWMDKNYRIEKNKFAYMEPLCTVPEHRNKGLARAALSKHYHIMKALGAQVMSGGANSFYAGIGFKNATNYTFWQKQI